jgi:shikimate dehydrogenase
MNSKSNSDIFVYGLVGKNISYSFSQNYFTSKFKELGFSNREYKNFDISSIAEFKGIVESQKQLVGLNVTIPYKEAVIPFLNKIDAQAGEIGAVNTIKVMANRQLLGFNTDVYGFEKSLEPLLKAHHRKALILGTGGASKAVAFVLKRLNLEFLFVSRDAVNQRTINYDSLTKDIMEDFQVVINCTPLGTFPKTEQFPPIPYEFITNQHLCYDLIYNPAETIFLRNAGSKGAHTKNGLEMLELQAEKAWEIWND